VSHTLDSQEQLSKEKSDTVVKNVEAANDIRSDTLLEIEQKMAKELIRSLNTKNQMVGEERIIQRYIEAEALNVTMQGIIKSDGATFSVDIELSLSRSLLIENEMSLAQFHDPLVINLKGDIPTLSEKQFYFDIDNDGESDQISLLKRGNAFLALDANNNGIIDNGGELFGVHSGNGFAELAQYDSDANGWIDANDPIFDKLRIWSKNENEDRLIAIAEVGIGAIFLGAASGDFTFKTIENKSLGQLRASGMLLFEDGRSGIISQIDFAKTTPQQLKEQRNDISEVQNSTRAFNAYSKEELKTEEESVSFEPDTIAKRIAILQKEYNQCKSRLASAQNDVVRSQMKSKMNLLQGQIIALFSSAI
jgi:hypothetical protein